MNSAASAPLLVTADLPRDVFAWADGLRRAHFPPERNKVRAHVTLFHALPPSCEGETAPADREHRRRGSRPPGADQRADAARQRHGFRDPQPRAERDPRRRCASACTACSPAQDQAKRKLHVTVQNKVTAAEAKALQAELAATFAPRDFAFAGLALHRYLGGVWADAGIWRFAWPRGCVGKLESAKRRWLTARAPTPKAPPCPPSGAFGADLAVAHGAE